MKQTKILSLLCVLYMIFSLSCSPPKKEETTELPKHILPINATGDLNFSVGQMVYVPAYSQLHSIYSGPEDMLINFAVTLSIRNTDLEHPIIIKSVRYFDDDGTFLKEFVETPFQLSKMASVSFNIKQSDKSGGIGANFIVKWAAEQSVYQPYIEAIMLGAHGSHGFSWRSPGYVIKEVAN